MSDHGMDRRAFIAATAAAGTLAAQSDARAQTAAAPVDVRGRTTIVIRGATIVSMDPAIGDLARGDILVQDGVIRAIGANLPAPADAFVIEAAGKIACPGFVNGHIHLPQVLQRGLSADHSFTDYFRQIVLRYSNRMTAADVGLGVRAGGLEQLSVGTTTIVDWNREVVSPDHADAAVEGHLASGARSILCYTVPLRGQDGATPNHARMMSHAKTLKAGKLSSASASVCRDRISCRWSRRSPISPCCAS
jgi:5-methylthioadenosine/S-adenosylhomocysteine deaminase